MVESSLNPLARSGAGAAGMWQFMRTTGREYGLEVNDNIDERYHVEKATRAACAYLKEAYAKYGDWLSVAASYNGGQRRISTELQRQHAAGLQTCGWSRRPRATCSVCWRPRLSSATRAAMASYWTAGNSIRPSLAVTTR